MAKLVCLLLGLTAILVGCNGTSSAPVLRGIAKGQPDYAVIDSRLDFARTNEPLSQVRGNTVELKAVGGAPNHRQKNYQVRYRFNSQETTSLKFMGHFVRPRYGGCDGQTLLRHSLQSNAGTVDFEGTEKVALQPQTDYTYILTLRTKCDFYEGELSVSVWAGSDTVEPKFDYVCRGPSGELAHFVEPVDFIQGYIQKRGTKERFLGSGNFCGIQIGKDGDCGASSGSAGPGEPTYRSVNCRAKTQSVVYNWTANFYPEFSSASVSCEVNGVQSYSEEFSDCKSMIIDYKQFKSAN